MRRSGLLLTLLLAAGCSWHKKPFADDPLVRKRQAIQGDHMRVVSEEPWVRPCPPDPPIEVTPPPKGNDAFLTGAGKNG